MGNTGYQFPFVRISSITVSRGMLNGNQTVVKCCLLFLSTNENINFFLNYVLVEIDQLSGT